MKNNTLVQDMMLFIASITLIEATVFILRWNNVLTYENPYFYDRTPTMEKSVVQWQVANISKIQSPPEILIVGDSSANMSIDPVLLSKLTHREVWDIGTLGWLGPQGHLEILKYYLSIMPAPSLIIYHASMHPYSIKKDKIDRIGFYRRLIPWIDELKTQKKYIPFKTLRSYITQKIVIGDIVERDETRGIWPSDQEMQISLLKNHGGMDDPRQNTYQNKEDYIFEIQEENLQIIREIAILANDRGSKFFLVNNPLPDNFETQKTVEHYKTLQSKSEAALHDLAESSLYLPFIRFYPVDKTANSAHLTPEGKHQNTYEIANFLMHHSIINYGAL